MGGFMFGWLKRQNVREHAKLIFQNAMANDLLPKFSPDMSRALQGYISA
jgi:hypothetical protein